MKKIAVFASGTGSNFDAIAQAIESQELLVEIVLVVVDKSHAPVIQKAKDRGIETFVFSAKDYENKAAYETCIVERCQAMQVEFIALAGYMRIISNVLLEAYGGRIVNIHPSLLPAFKGKDAIGQALDYGVKVMGVSIHYVDDTLDGGKIIAQRAFDITEFASREDIESHLHTIEHQLYPATLKQLLEEKV